MAHLPLASTGTGVSSPCRRSAAMTWASIRSCSGFSATVQAPTLVGQGRQAEIDTLPRVAVALAVQRLVLPVLLEQDRRQQVGGQPSPAASGGTAPAAGRSSRNAGR